MKDEGGASPALPTDMTGFHGLRAVVYTPWIAE